MVAIIMNYNATKFITFLIVATIVALSSSLPLYAVENGSVGGKPARPRDDNPRSQSIFVHEMEPGDSIEEAILIVNNSDQVKTINVYPVDSQIASGGTFTCAQKLDLAVGVGTWIKLAEEKITLEPDSTKEVPFTISVPKNASPGEQNGCIAIQAEEPPQSTQQEGVTLSFRSAIRVAITVPGEITKNLVFSGPIATRQENSTIRMSAGLRNNGNVSLDADIRVELRSFFGNTIRRVGGQYPVLSGNELVLNFETNPPFWGGWYRVDGRATYSSDTTKSLGEGGVEETINSPSSTIFVRPQPIALFIEAVILIAFAGLIAWLLIRRRYYSNIESNAQVYTIKKTDTLHKIATHHNTSWKEIAKINKLKAPYHLEPGAELKLPPKKDKQESNSKK